MTNEKMDLEGQINEKKAQIKSMEDMQASYAKTVGRDRWYNRSHWDLVGLRQELAALEISRTENSAPT